MTDERRQAWLVLLLMIASVKRRGSSSAPGGPWWPGDGNLGTSPVPEGTHPEPRRPPLK